MRALLWPLFARSTWAQASTMVACTTGEGAALASVSLFGVGSDSHCGGGHGSCGRCSGLCSLSRHGFSQPLWWRTRQVRSLLWPLFASSAWAQPVTELVGKIGEGTALACVRSVGVGSASHFGGRHDR
jgi:hypothetical protein